MEFKEYILERLEQLHIELNYKSNYENTEDGIVRRLKDTVRYEQLREVVIANPDWNDEEMSLELSERIRMKISLH